MKTIAYAHITDWDACRDKYLEIGYGLKEKLSFPGPQVLGISQEDWSHIHRVYENCMDKQYRTTFWDNRRGETDEERHQRNLLETLELLEGFVRFHQQYNTPIAVIYRTEDWGIFEFGDEHFILPLECVVVQEMKDYSQVGQHRLARLLSSTSSNSGNELAEYDGESAAEVNAHIDTVRSSIQQAKQEIDDLYRCRTGELAELQAEIDRQKQTLKERQRELMAIVEAKKAELEEKMTQLNNELFVLETQIYSIRCYTGEIIRFTQLRSGANASPETPVVLWQKMRFMDEELGKMASIYNVDWDDVGLFESFITNNPDAFETFCPSEKCVSLVRISRTASHFGASLKYKYCLDRFKMYHGMQIGILVRNGENLYIGWTDDDQVNMPDDMFYIPKEVTMSTEDGEKQHTSSKEETASRLFIFYILQGVLDRKEMIQFPEKVSVFKPSQYVVWSAADAWLVDNTYGNFREMLDKTQVAHKQGDDILTVIGLCPGGFRYCGGYTKNDRGRGWADRTHDVSVDSNEICQINLVEKDEARERVRYGVPGKTEYFTTRRLGEVSHFDKDVVVYDVEIYQEEHYYVSLLKQWSPSGNARANFEVMESEFVNLTFLNSVWVQHVIMNRDLGGWVVGGKEVDYAYAIPYLNRMKEYLVKREQSEARLIKAHFPDLDSVSDWQVRLSEWKIAHRVRAITDYQAKRFAKTL